MGSRVFEYLLGGAFFASLRYPPCSSTPVYAARLSWCFVIALVAFPVLCTAAGLLSRSPRVGSGRA
eukprot:1129423-Alexandrium_andersonii.AAC.1